MYIHGYFYNTHSERIDLYILTQGDRTQQLEVGKQEDKAEICWGDDPMELTSQVNDTFDPLLCSQANVTLLCRHYLQDFFCNSCRDAVVNIYKGEACIFAGYIEPQTFSQDYSEEYDEVGLTCVDALSALRYSNYQDIGALGVNYADVKRKARQRTFGSMLEEMIKGVTDGIDLKDGSTPKVFYDGSKAVDATEAHRYTVLDDISVSELLFLGDEEDDVWTQEEVVEEMMRYLNLHLMQVGKDIYLFSWETLRKGGSIQWKDLKGGDLVSMTMGEYEIQTDDTSDETPQLSVSATYNQLLLTDKVEEMESIVESPLDGSSLTPAFGGMQKYMTEYSADGKAKSGFPAFRDMVKGVATSYDRAQITDWFVQVKTHASWKFYTSDGKGTHVNIADEYYKGENQQRVLTDALRKGIGAAIVAMGSVEKKNGGNDNSPVTSVALTDNLVLAVNGSDTFPTEDNILKACPVAEYVGNTAGGNFSPSDEDTINYVVVSGKLVLNPTMDMTGRYSEIKKAAESSDLLAWTTYRGVCVPCRTDTGGRWYTCQYWKAKGWRDEVSQDDDADSPEKRRAIYPFTNTGPEEYEFSYSAIGDYTDNVSKVGVVQCMLIIGDKCVVEKQPGETLGTDKAGTGNGTPDDFVWQRYKTRQECASDDEYYRQSFAIGFDPKLKDKIVGTEFDIQKNAPYTLGISAEGTAIPIHKADQVSGQVRFLILGPVNAEWNQITRRHPSFWRHTKWGSESVSLLQKIQSIFIRDFEVKVKSDNGLMGDVDDKDIVYMSDTKESFVNKKDDLEFKFTTALTSKECKQLGVNNSVKLSSPMNTATGDALGSIYDRNSETTAKPEQHYVDNFWQEWHEPRVEMRQGMMDQGKASPFGRYHLASIGKTFFVEGIDRNLENGTATLILKEVF